MYFRLPSVAALVVLAGVAVGCSTAKTDRANYLWSHGFGWHAADNPVVFSNPLLRCDNLVLGVAPNHSHRPYFVQADLNDGTLTVERLERDAAPSATLQSRMATAYPGKTFKPVAPRSDELVEILRKLRLDRTYVSEPLRESTGSRIGRGVDTKATTRIDPNTLPAGDSQSLNTN